MFLKHLKETKHRQHSLHFSKNKPILSGSRGVPVICILSLRVISRVALFKMLEQRPNQRNFKQKLTKDISYSYLNTTSSLILIIALFYHSLSRKKKFFANSVPSQNQISLKSSWVRLLQSKLKLFEFPKKKWGSMVVSGKLPAYPSHNLTLTLSSFLGQNVRFEEGWVVSFPRNGLIQIWTKNIFVRLKNLCHRWQFWKV